MRISVETKVQSSVRQVESGFTKELFLKLNPPFPPVNLIRFDGCKKGDLVILELNFLISKQWWESLITDDYSSNNEFSFTDVGISLPFFLTKWKHHHIVVKKGGNTMIIDDVTFSTPTLLTNFLLYPFLYLQFLYRKPVYRKVFDS